VTTSRNSKRVIWPQITQITQIKELNNLLLARSELSCRGMNPGLIQEQSRDQNSEHQLARRHH
jgi:hypothetical protein